MEERKNQNCDYISPVVNVIDVAVESIICQSGELDYRNGGSTDFDELS